MTCFLFVLIKYAFVHCFHSFAKCPIPYCYFAVRAIPESLIGLVYPISNGCKRLPAVYVYLGWENKYIHINGTTAVSGWLMGRRLGNAALGAFVLAGSESGGTCANGLPLASGVVRMIGRLAKLQEIEGHEGLVRHIAIVRCTTVSNAAVIVSEHYSQSIEDDIERLLLDAVVSVGRQVASAISHVHRQRATIGMLDLSTVLIKGRDESGGVTVRLALFGLPTLSNNGIDLAIPIGSPFTLSPERLLSSVPSPCSRKSDIWAYGILLLQMVTGVSLSRVFTTNEWICVMNEIIGKNKSLFSMLIDKISGKVEGVKGREENARIKEEKMMEMVEKCLYLNPRLRPKSDDIEKILLRDTGKEEEEEIEEGSIDEEDEEEWIVNEMSMEDVLFVWTLSGSSIEKLLIDRRIIKTNPCVLSFPLLSIDDLCMIGNEDGRRCHALQSITMLPMNNLRQKLLSIDPLTVLHSFELKEDGIIEDKDLPLVVKEKDVSYQASRMSLISHILYSHPYKPNLLSQAVSLDIPPMRRSLVWRALLGVNRLRRELFDGLDTLSVHTSDRQLDVDIPRCHQYEEMMSSPAAHHKLKRLLKAWLVSHPQYVYWQGLDSLAAPFLLLNFDDLAMALACMSSFIDRYLNDFFLKDNSHVIQEYLAVFNHLLAFVDAPLYSSLAQMDFFPELYAIPWFLTCFSHVLPLHKLMHIWDALLLSNASFPLFVGVSILQEMRPSLLGASFNDVILLFSDLPDLHMDRILSQSMKLYSKVPSSCVFLAHSAANQDSDMSVLSVPQLKSFSCPRISPSQLISLIHNHSVALIDLRPPPEFQRGSIIGSVNYTNLEDESFSSIKVLLENAQGNDHPICLVDVHSMKNAKKISKQLVYRGFNGICILNGGYDSVRSVQSIIHVSYD